jgi:hypothetical protein
MCCAAALMDLRSQLTNGPLPALDTWAMQTPPCSPWDAVCQPCLLPLNASLCGQPVPPSPGYTGPPRRYCSMQGVWCDPDGNRQVIGVSLRGSGAVLTRIPASFGQLVSLQTLGEWCHHACSDLCLIRTHRARCSCTECRVLQPASCA